MQSQAASQETGNDLGDSASAVRYSQQGKDIGAAKNFSWEHPVPRNTFWDDLSFSVARNFLQAFTAEELRIVRIDPNSTQSKEQRLRLLGKWLKKKLIQQEAQAAPQSFYDVDYIAWERVMLGSFTIQHELGDLAGAEETLRFMIDHRKDKSNLSHLHSLAALQLDRGQYAEAEETGRKVEAWLIEKLGSDSPQALSAKRVIILALWKQGRSRHAEAELLLKELQGNVNSMGSGQYAVYQDGERDLMKTLMSQMD
ncbi:hypothetical protein F5Y19DRAFT_424097 [Xylariaceae sp. FL1651]|nr:hypothetical protein F5Y19DRAFT_424097 [Xylariaceae sp. FL1651]